jgi:hypothetical protein
MTTTAEWDIAEMTRCGPPCAATGGRTRSPAR